MSNRKLDEKIESLKRLRILPPTEDALATIRAGLQDRAGVVVAEAARTAGALGLSLLQPELVAAFHRLFNDAVKVDPKCWGKTAIAKVLIQFETTDSAPFVRGSKHVQMEPVWGGQEDSAVQLRATCILALVQCDDLLRPEILRRVVDAMADPADPVRLEAVRAVAQLGGDEASLLLRLKARIGDKRPVVTGQVFDALLALESQSGLELVAEFLNLDDIEVREEAALAIGGSRSPQAINILIEAWKDNTDGEFADVLLRALSGSRQQTAIAFLLDIVRTGSARQAGLAIDALKVHEESPEIQALVEQAKRDRSNTR